MTDARIDTLNTLAPLVGPERAHELVRALVREAETEMAHKCAPMSNETVDVLLTLVSYGGSK